MLIYSQFSQNIHRGVLLNLCVVHTTIYIKEHVIWVGYTVVCPIPQEHVSATKSTHLWLQLNTKRISPKST